MKQPVNYETKTCPYYKDRLWVSEIISQPKRLAGNYQELIDQGFRRSGQFFFRNICPACQECMSLRVDVANFKASRSQRKNWRKNSDLNITIHKPQSADQELLDLFNNYISARHNQPKIDKQNLEKLFLLPCSFAYQVDYRLADKLVAVGWIDLLPLGLSSVYFIYDLTQKNRRLGCYSLLWELDLARRLNLKWHYLGYWFANDNRIAYKGCFRPHQLLDADGWSYPHKKTAPNRANHPSPPNLRLDR